MKLRRRGFIMLACLLLVTTSLSACNNNDSNKSASGSDKPYIPVISKVSSINSGKR